jgi:hypothetical protein
MPISKAISLLAPASGVNRCDTLGKERGRLETRTDSVSHSWAGTPLHGPILAHPGFSNSSPSAWSRVASSVAKNQERTAILHLLTALLGRTFAEAMRATRPSKTTFLLFSPGLRPKTWASRRRALGCQHLRAGASARRRRHPRLAPRIAGITLGEVIGANLAICLAPLGIGAPPGFLWTSSISLSRDQPVTLTGPHLELLDCLLDCRLRIRLVVDNADEFGRHSAEKVDAP